jgi:hypothetical protein
MKGSFVLYNSYYDPIKHLTDAEKGQLLDALFQSQIDGKVRELSPVCQMAFNFIKSQLDRDSAKYDRIVERNRINGLKGGRPKENPQEPIKPSGINGMPEKPKKADNDNDDDNEDEKIKNSVKNIRFSPPTLQEVQNYFDEKIQSGRSSLNAKIEAEKFESFYSSKNWMVGKNKMVNWKKSVSGWIARSQDKKPIKTNGHEVQFKEKIYKSAYELEH